MSVIRSVYTSATGSLKRAKVTKLFDDSIRNKIWCFLNNWTQRGRKKNVQFVKSREAANELLGTVLFSKLDWQNENESEEQSRHYISCNIYVLHRNQCFETPHVRLKSWRPLKRALTMSVNILNLISNGEMIQSWTTVILLTLFKNVFKRSQHG